MLPFTEEISMLNPDNVSIFDQFEDRHFQGFDMFPNNMMPPQDFSMGEKHQPMAQPMASPMSPPEGDMFAADATFLELGNYCYSNQPSPTSTDISEQEMTEAYEIVMEDILSTIFSKLGISTDPSQWSPEEAQAWVSLLIQEYGRPEVNLSNFQVDGYTLCQMTQEELEQRAPGSGYLILSNLNCLTKSIQRDEVKPVLSPYQQQQHFHQQQQQQQQQPPQPQAQPMTYDPNMMYTYPMTPMPPTSPAPTERELSPSPSSSDEEEASMSSPARSPTGPNTSMTPHHTGSIQLWQFLQELLLQPDSYNYCIRFLDRSQGIFKIEDSVEVARLWGMRKNRPAMNYDKLSRSIRQYYRKGIMKKTEISQRLVYQFVTPF